MKKIIGIPKLIVKISLILVWLLVPLFSKADINAIGQISNCYQRINITSGKNIRLLNIGGTPEISLYAGSTGTAFHYFTIQQYDPATGTYVFLNFPQPFIWLNDPDHGGLVRAYQNDFSTFRSTVVLPGTAPLLINFYVQHQASPGGPVTYAIAYHDVAVNFIGINDAFTIQPAAQSCYTYDNFQFKNIAPALEGLCNNLSFELSLPPGAPNTMGLPANFRRGISFRDSTSQVTSIPVNQQECTNPNYACPSNVSCGCIDFNLDILLFPCAPGNPNCPEVTTVTKSIRICCRCGIPDNPYFPGMGRTAGNAGLSEPSGGISIFPNPNHDGKLQLSAPNSPLQNIRIYAVDGRLVKEFNVPDLHKVSVDISGLKPGMYQVSMRDSRNTTVNQKLVIE